MDRSSVSPGQNYTARWFFLEFTPSHPMVALGDVTADAIENGELLYLEAGDDMARNVAPIEGMGGVDVYVREQGTNGCCESTLECDPVSEQAVPGLWDRCECRAGFSLDQGSGSCVPCAAGHAKPLPGGDTVCKPCPENTYAPSGSAGCTPCPTGTVSQNTSTSVAACEMSRGMPCMTAPRGGVVDVTRRDTCSGFVGWNRVRRLPAGSSRWFSGIDGLLGVDHRTGERSGLPDDGLSREVATAFDPETQNLNLLVATEGFSQWVAAHASVLQAAARSGREGVDQALVRSSGASGGLDVGLHTEVLMPSPGPSASAPALRVWRNTSVHFDVHSDDCPLRLRLRDLPEAEMINTDEFGNFNNIADPDWNYAQHDAADCSVVRHFVIDLKAVYTVYAVHYVMYWDLRSYCNQRVQVSETGEFAGEETEVFHCDTYKDCDDSMQIGRTVMIRARRARYVRIGASRSDHNTQVHFVSADVLFTPCHAAASYLVQRFEGAVSLFQWYGHTFPFHEVSSEYSSSWYFLSLFDDDRNRNAVALSNGCEEPHVRYYTLDLGALYQVEMVQYTMYHHDGRKQCMERVQVSPTGEFAGEHVNYWWCTHYDACGNPGWHGRKAWAPGRSTGDPRSGVEGLAPARYVRIGMGRSNKDGYARLNNLRLTASPYLAMPTATTRVRGERMLHMTSSAQFKHSGEVCDFGRWGPQLNALYAVWCADRNVRGEEWLQLDVAGSAAAGEKVTGVVTQGRFDHTQYVTSFRVQVLSQTLQPD